MALDILFVDDEPAIRLPFGDALRAAGHRLHTASDGSQALALLEANSFDLVVTDIRLPGPDGAQILRRVKKEWPSTYVILITAYGSVADAVGALKEGATDYLTKPFEVEELLHRIDRVDSECRLKRDLEQARADLAAAGPERVLVGRSPPMTRMFERIDGFAVSDAAVLITGESGTGKELVARTLHERSDRRGKPFVAVNCAAFPETLIEAELFGHERGAFTGAVKKREGRFKAAHGGTLFLDEVAEVPLPAQAKLLRVLQEGIFEPLGTNTPVKVDVRIVSATHRNLREWIATNRFREDLFFRLNVLPLQIPPLRERKGDLPLLVEHFLERFGAKKATRPTLTARAWAALTEYSWPGNVRELEHAIQHGVVLSRGGEIELHHLPAEVAGPLSPGDDASGLAAPATLRPLGDALREFEREYLLRAVRASGGKKADAAERLGISRKNLWEKLRAHAIGADEIGPAAGEEEP